MLFIFIGSLTKVLCIEIGNLSTQFTYCLSNVEVIRMTSLFVVIFALQLKERDRLPILVFYLGFSSCLKFLAQQRRHAVGLHKYFLFVE
jgi:hypothetical protein